MSNGTWAIFDNNNEFVVDSPIPVLVTNEMTTKCKIRYAWYIRIFTSNVIYHDV